MNIHEHQAKGLLKKFGVSVPDGYLAFTVEEAVTNAKKLPGPVYVVKAQIHAGGRGKAGGVKVVKNIEEVEKASEEILGKVLVTPQTGSKGKKVQRLYIEDGCQIDKEFYFSILVDRNAGCISIISSTEGGVNIEEVAEKTPEKIIKAWVNNDTYPFDDAINTIINSLSLNSFNDAFEIFENIYNCYSNSDCNLLEINPLVITEDQKIIALDAKVDIDSNALFSQEKIAEFHDTSEEDPLELKASEYGLNYIKLDGNVGCMVNGAGLAMATMDIVKHHGGEPANFLDVGGAANVDTIKNGFKIILSDPNVKSVLINIFGGIVRCDRVANGVIQAVKELNLNVGVVVRLQGTNAKLAKQILDESDIDLISAETIDEAAKKAVRLVS